MARRKKEEIVSNVRRYNIYKPDLDAYDGQVHLCTYCADTFTIEGETVTLHDLGPSNKSCEVCGDN